MNNHQTLDKIYSSIVLPMVCTYSSDIFATHTSESASYLMAFENECRSLHSEFIGRKISTDIEVLLMLLPVPCKDKLNTELDKRLKAMQAI